MRGIKEHRKDTVSRGFGGEMVSTVLQTVCPLTMTSHQLRFIAVVPSPFGLYNTKQFVV